MTASPIPTARAPTGRRRNIPSWPDCADEVRGYAIAATTAIAVPNAATAVATRVVRVRATLYRRGLVDQHDRDAVTHRIFELVPLARQRILCPVVFEWPLALGADEDFEELRC